MHQCPRKQICVKSPSVLLKYIYIACANHVAAYAGTTVQYYPDGKTLEECHSECLDRDDCEYYTYMDVVGRCSLFSEVTGMNAHRGYVSGHQSCYFKHQNSKMNFF